MPYQRKIRRKNVNRGRKSSMNIINFKIVKDDVSKMNEEATKRSIALEFFV